MSRVYPAKILLYGEHTVLRGGSGLAVPFPAFSLRWAKRAIDDRLLKLAAYLVQEIPSTQLKAAELRQDLREGWRLDGNIPTGYGLGSSGAVCAAIWDRYATEAGKALIGESLRQTLATMEGYFHGQSSGTDPLICYLNQPVVLGGGKPPTAVELPAGWAEGFFLVDSGIEREASTFIGQFARRYDQGEGDQIAAGWTALADAAIRALVAGDQAKTELFTQEVSRFQQQYFPAFIPEHLRNVWSGKGYVLKLCGAGGGGMMLGVGSGRDAIEEAFGDVIWLADFIS